MAILFPKRSIYLCTIVLTYIDVGAVQAGISPDFSFYLISIANVSSAPGRILTGIVADRVGKHLVLQILTFGL